MTSVPSHGFDGSDEFARGIFDALAEGVLVADHHGRVVATNPSAERVLGFAAGALVGQNVRDTPWILEDEEERRLTVDEWPIMVTLKTRQPSGQLMVTLRPDGERRVIVMIAMPLLRPKTDPWTVVSFVDITRQRRAELALASSEERFRQLVEQAPDPVIVVNAEGVIATCNQRTGDVFGYDTAELVGQPIEMLVPDAARSVHRALRSGLIGASTSSSIGAEAELSGRRKDGRAFPIEVSLGPLQTSGGPKVVLIARDLTERRRAQEDALVDRAKGEFLSRMSHELRTPLNSILGFSQLLELGVPRPDQIEALEQIQHAGHHLLDLLNDLLEFERIRSGHVTFSIEPVNVEEAVQEALHLVAPTATASDITTEMVFVERASWVACDRQRLRQVLLNLISNAIKYNRAGGRVVVETDLIGERVSISIVDTGRGIPSAQMDRLFVPFERLGADTNSSVEGTGVGLAVSKTLIEGMEGTIDVASVESEGSTFRITLPQAVAPRLVEAPQSANLPTPAIDERLFDLSVLYIEDNAANVRLVEALLAAFGITRVATATTAAEGLQLALQNPPDVVLLDLHLPDSPGEYVVQQLRNSASTASIPIVVVTADASPATERTMIAAGVERYVTKPIDVTQLFEAIVAVTSASERR